MRSAPPRTRPVTPVAETAQRRCTWDESVLFTAPPVKRNETAWPPCLASVSCFTHRWVHCANRRRLCEPLRHCLKTLAKLSTRHWGEFQDDQTQNLAHMFCVTFSLKTRVESVLVWETKISYTINHRSHVYALKTSCSSNMWDKGEQTRQHCCCVCCYSSGMSP